MSPPSPNSTCSAPPNWRARLIAFATDVIVPRRILDRLGFGAYNFHPGPPSYPGWGPAHFAIYDGAATFGVTAHVMVDRVDAWPIVGVDMFCIPPGATVARLEQLAFAALARSFWNLAPALTQDAPLATQPIAWSGTKSTRRRHQAMRTVPVTVTKDDLDRRVTAFGAPDSGDELCITLHGHRFRYVAPEAEAPQEEPELLAIEKFARRA